MLRFLGARLAVLVPTFLGVTFVAFILIRLVPGDPILMMVGERGMTPERHAADDGPVRLRPAAGACSIWASSATCSRATSAARSSPASRCWGSSSPCSRPRSSCRSSPCCWRSLIGIPAGILAAVKRGSILDHTVMGVSLTGFSMPIFWWGLLLIILFSGILQWTPVSGRISLIYFVEAKTGFMLIDSLLSDEKGAFRSALSHLILPAIVLGTVPLAVIARQTRSAMLEVLGEDYVRTARAKGLPPSRVIGLHALRNALIPVVTVIGLLIGTLFGGAILTETIFAWPGVGKWLVDSITRRDYPSVQGGVVLIASIVMLVNLGVDLLYGLINPRIRHGS